MDNHLDFLINKALTLEKQFSQNKYFGTREMGLFQYVEGNIPIILSAPHTVRQIRNGLHKKADIFTGSMSIILQELTNCHLIYRTYTGKGDANRDIECPYKAHLIEKITDNNILYLIDLHGMGEYRDFDVDVGTLKGKSINQFLKTTIINSFQNYGIMDVRFDCLFDADKEGTVTNTIWQHKAIHAFQIEINAIYRNLKVKKNHKNFYRLVRSLETLILSLVKLKEIGETNKAL